MVNISSHTKVHFVTLFYAFCLFVSLFFELDSLSFCSLSLYWKERAFLLYRRKPYRFEGWVMTEYSVPLMRSTSTWVYRVIFKSTFLPLRSLLLLLFFFAKAWSMLFRTSLCFLNLPHPLFTLISFHCFRSEVILYSYLLSTFPPSVLFTPRLSFFDSVYPFMSFIPLCFF